MSKMNVRLVPCLTNLLLSLLTGVLHSNISGGQKTFLVGERPKVEIIRPSIPRNLTKVGPETVSKPSAARNLPVNVQAGR